MDCRTLLTLSLLTLFQLCFGVPTTLKTIDNLHDTFKFNENPVIGILAGPYCLPHGDKPGGFNHGCESSPAAGIDLCSVQYFESAGFQVVPIPYHASESEVDFLLTRINGVFFTGGDLSLEPNTTYYKVAKRIFDHSLNAKDNGDYFPLLGVCMGFQLLSILGAQDYSVLDHSVYVSEGVNFKLDRNEPETSQSRLFGKGSPAVVNNFFEKAITVNFHYDGVHPKRFVENKNLANFYRVITTNLDLKNRPFVSTIEAFNYPIYGTQWHPETVQFDHNGRAQFIDRSPESLEATQYISHFFLKETRKSKQRFSSEEEKEQYLMYNYAPHREAQGSGEYLFMKK